MAKNETVVPSEAAVPDAASQGSPKAAKKAAKKTK